jgi:uncharacterized membrane protein
MSKLKTFATYLIGSQLMLGVVAVCTYLNEGALEGYFQLWGSTKVFLAIAALELAGIGIVYLMIQDAKKIEDERDSLIELKSYRLSFQILTISLLGLLVGNSLSPMRSPVLVAVALIVIANFSRVVTQAYFKHTH